MPESLLSVNNLVTAFDTDAGRVTAIDRVSFEIEKGKTLGIVGESGCGKSVTALSIMRLLPQPTGKILGGEILFEGEDLTKISHEKIRKIRGNKISMIFQEPMTALNPVHRIGKQLSETFLLHQDITKEEALKKSIDILQKVGIPAPEIRIGEYPHQLSGGMRQRVVIAMALACEPDLVIADEPTTALDVTIQAQILELMRSMQKDMGMSIIMITHDLGVIAETCSDVIVMYAGKVAEKGTVFDIFETPKHPYTKGLLQSIPRLRNKPKIKLHTIEGMVPGLLDLPSGCRFQNRCPHKDVQCETNPPPIESINEHHQVSCFHWKKISKNSNNSNLT